MKFYRHFLGLILCIGLALILSGCACEHNWEEATCTAPMVCIKCGKTQGTALGHDWKEATCTEAKSCLRCGTVEGNALGHTPGEWTADEPNYVTGVIWTRQRCSVCGELLDSKISSASLRKDGHFLLTPNEFSERLGGLFPLLNGCTYKTRFVVTEDGTMGSTIMDGNSQIGTILFCDDGSIMDGDQKDSRGAISSMICSFSSSDASEVAPGLLGIILACDESLEISDASDIAKGVLVNSIDGSAYTHHGISYLLGSPEGKYLLVVSLSEQ